MKEIDKMSLEEINDELELLNLRKEELMKAHMEEVLWMEVVNAMKKYCQYCDTCVAVYTDEVEETFGLMYYSENAIEDVMKVPGLIDFTTE